MFDTTLPKDEAKRLEKEVRDAREAYWKLWRDVETARERCRRFAKAADLTLVED